MEQGKCSAIRKQEEQKKPWITDKMIERMDDRRKWKNNNTEEEKKKYSSLNKKFWRETDKARENWWEARCEKLIEYDRRGRSDLLYNEVSRLT